MEQWYLRVKNKEQLQAVRSLEGPFGLVVEGALWETALGYRELYISLPDVARENRIRDVERMIARCPEGAGLVVRNLDELGMIREMGYPGPLIGDASLYAYNREALSFYLELFPQMRFLCSDELTDRELSELAEPERWIYKIYGYQQLMVSAQCISRNYTGCRKKKLQFRDGKGRNFYALSDCSNCSSLIYNGRPTFMLDKIAELPYSSFLLDFTLESRREMLQILDLWQKIRSGEAVDTGAFPEKQQITRGHHYEGID